MPRRHLYPDLNKICHSTLERYNRSCIPTKRVFLDILESLKKALQLFYYKQYMIPCLNKPNNTVIQICTEHMQKLTENYKPITPKPIGLKSWNFRTSQIRKLYTTLVFMTFTENIICIMKLSPQQRLL